MGGLNGPSQEFVDQLLATIPRMRSYVLHRTNDWALTDDILQEAAIRILLNHHLFQPNTNFTAWAITIARNVLYNVHRTVSSREVRVREIHDTSLVTGRDDMERRLEFRDLKRALAMVSDIDRHLLLSLALNGHTYETLSQETGLAVGTIKSRISRTRRRLLRILENDLKLTVRRYRRRTRRCVKLV